ncbi:hypothetical protein BKA64DRAFT_430273 [Cadophora sp. MPI-SDFR-AT-0126]|nr:hypothetical protein BKA64DRAFT_430273 [Leotiomycetes sp. MPI-SDFR-AT-0126]
MIEVRSAGVKGLGVFAKKLIPRGTRIFSERPLLTVHGQDASTLYPAIKLLNTKDRDALMALTSFRDRELDLMRWSVVLVHTAQNTLAAAFRALVGKKGFAQATAKNSLADHVEALSIFRSNAFNIGPKLGTSLFPRIARINHSCLPNAQGNFHEPLGKFNVHATRDIRPGEEVSLNYLLETGALRHVRVENLSKGYGFDCACPACDMSGKRGKDGEEKRVAMIDVLKAFVEQPMAGNITDKEAELETMKAFIELYESEGIAGRELSNLYLKAAEINFEMKNLKDGLVYAARAVRLDRDTFGEDHPDYKKSVEIVNTFKIAEAQSRNRVM